MPKAHCNMRLWRPHRQLEACLVGCLEVDTPKYQARIPVRTRVLDQCTTKDTLPMVDLVDMAAMTITMMRITPMNREDTTALRRIHIISTNSLIHQAPVLQPLDMAHQLQAMVLDRRHDGPLHHIEASRTNLRLEHKYRILVPPEVSVPAPMANCHLPGHHHQPWDPAIRRTTNNHSAS